MNILLASIFTIYFMIEIYTNFSVMVSIFNFIACLVSKDVRYRKNNGYFDLFYTEKPHFTNRGRYLLKISKELGYDTRIFKRIANGTEQQRDFIKEYEDYLYDTKYKYESSRDVFDSDLDDYKNFCKKEGKLYKPELMYSDKKFIKKVLQHSWTYHTYNI